MNRKMVMGDIHGAHKALVQCLERSKFDYENDVLIPLGDIVDRWSQSYECVEELLKIKNLIAIRGNHDDWCLTMLNTGIHPGLQQGGRSTLDSYRRYCDVGDYTGVEQLSVPESHLKFFRTQHNYYILDRKLFVHGGFNRHELINEQHYDKVYYWDRDLWAAAMSYQSMAKKYENEEAWVSKFKYKDTSFDEVFIGHTSTTNWSEHEENITIGGIILQTHRVPIITPMKAANIWNIDTGCGSNKGKLTIMDIDTKEYWQSDFTRDLYPDEVF